MDDVNSKAKQGIKLLMYRQVAIQVLTFGGGVVLARVLGPAQFGLYALSSMLVGAFALFADFGLAPALIKRKENLNDADLRTAFTLQQTLITTVVLIILVSSSRLAHFYPKAPPGTVWLIRVLALNLYLGSWRTMSALQLERHLQFDKLAWIEVVESVSYQAIAVIMAVRGYGVWSYVAATISSAIIGNILTYSAAPWPVRFGFDKTLAKEILTTGLSFQMMGIIYNMGNWTTPFFVGRVIGPRAVGLLTWASSNGRKPLTITASVIRVAFPHLSRVQDDKEEVERLLVRYCGYLSVPAFLWFVLIATAGYSVVKVVYSSKWLPGVPALIIMSYAVIFDILTWLFSITINIFGKVSLTNTINVIRSVANIILAVTLVKMIGFIGVPIAYATTQTLSSVWYLEGIGRGATKRICMKLAWLLPPLFAGLIVGKLVAVATLPVSEPVAIGSLAARIAGELPLALSAIATMAAATAAYGLALWIVGPSWLKQSIVGKIPQRFRPALKAA
jgi:O-antigen/teichoic acid export membrane protein